MGREPRELARLKRIRQSLAEVRTIDEIKDIRDELERAKSHAKKKGLAQEIIMDASVIKLEAQRKLGQWLRRLPLAKGSPGNQYTGRLDRSHDGTGPVRLRDLGITKSDSSRAQRIAALPRKTFNEYIEDNVEAGREPTTAGALRLARELEVAEYVNGLSYVPDGFVSNLDELVEHGKKFATVYADPPWDFDNQGTRAATSNHYPTMPLSDICAEPVAQLVADRAHLHLWVPDGFLREAFEVIDAWGFRYAGSAFVWVKPHFGLGNFWRSAHEILLFASKGNLPFLDNTQRSWQQHDRTRHSKKPEEVGELIEKVSPGPYLEMYGRSTPRNSNWTVYGNQIEDETQP